MSPRFKGRLGLVILALVFLGSVGYALVGERLPGECVFGTVPGRQATVCALTFSGLWRSAATGLISGGAATLLALGLALLARRAGGVVEQALVKGAEVVFSIPDVLILVAIAFAAKMLRDAGKLDLSPFWLMTGSLVAIGWAAPMRMIVNRLRSLEEQEFVFAARSLGATRGRVLMVHVLPLARPFVLAIFLFRVPTTILTESTVSFLLGAGASGSSDASLGAFIAQNYRTLMVTGFRVVGPALGLFFLLIVGFHWAGQAVQARADRT